MNAIYDFRFERNATPGGADWVPIAGVATYLAVLAAVRMSPGKPWRSVPLEVVHNAFMVAVSLAVMLGTAWGAFLRVAEDGQGVKVLFCAPTARTGTAMWDGPLGFFVYLFYIFKYYELFDTVILALRRKPLLPLHVYHHAIMPFVCYSWFRFPWLEGSAWCAFVNSAIHVAMYWYYLQTVLGNRVWWKKYLTTLQIVQFLSGAAWVATFLFFRTTGDHCEGNVWTSAFSFAVNLTFIALFAGFYRSTYKKPLTSKAQ